MPPAAETRERILECAWEIVREGGLPALTMQAVADAAGVSRQLVYLHFDNRAGLLTRMARRRDRVSGFADRVTAALELEPVECLERLVRDWCTYIPDILPVARALELADAVGDEGSGAWQDRMSDLRRVYRDALRRIDAAGLLAEGWTVDRATDWVYARTHLSTWVHLVLESGWSRRRYLDEVLGSLRRDLLVS